MTFKTSIITTAVAYNNNDNRLAAPIFAAPIADLYNMSLAASHVPLQWKTAVVKPVLKQNTPLQ